MGVSSSFRHRLRAAFLIVAGSLVGLIAPDSARATGISVADSLGPGGYTAGDFSITGTPTAYQNSSAVFGLLQGDTGGGQGGLTPFNPAYSSAQIAAIGAGGSLTVHMSNPIVANGYTLGIFTNNGITDTSGNGSGKAGNPAQTFSDLPQAVVSVSQNGTDWRTLNSGNPVTFSNPTNYYTDQPIVNGHQAIGSQAAFQQKPFLGSLSSFNGQTYAQIKTTLNQSAGGTWIDTSGSNLTQINYVRLSVPQAATFRTIVDSIAGTVAAAPIVANQEIISESVGAGSNTSHVVVDFGPQSYDFIVHYNGSISGQDALTLLQNNSIYRYNTHHFSFGDLVSEMDYGGYDYSGIGNSGTDFWSYYVGDGTSWSFASTGAADRLLTNGSYDGWVWYDNQQTSPDVPLAVPEPATLSALLLIPLGLLRRSRLSISR